VITVVEYHFGGGKLGVYKDCLPTCTTLAKNGNPKAFLLKKGRQFQSELQLNRSQLSFVSNQGGLQRMAQLVLYVVELLGTPHTSLG
jgi:hypothetical protein